jgi:hypothetical protein
MTLFSRVVVNEGAAEELPTALYIWLTDQAKAKLLRVVPPLYSNRSADHLTIAFQPTAIEYARFKPLAGKFVTLVATHVVSDGRLQAVRVKDVKTRLGTPHITVSWMDGAKPVESNQLVASSDGKSLSPWLKLQGRYGYVW